ncbi:putative quinol monooxygenase [Novosphingobium sp.]|uniref:putative quinol monooxygenase n=1 Tax=Novosphingobium sp. TaxID=1874826 RepID=UPI0031D4C22F
MIVWVEFVVMAQHRAAFLERVLGQARDSMALEPACQRFDVATDGRHDDRVLLYEIYDDAAAFDAHLASAHFKAFDAEVTPWILSKKVELLDGPL